MKILIIGADGQLGSDLCKVIPQEEQIPLTIKDLDITNQEQTVAVLKKHQPDIVINTAAYNDVDQAEEKPELALAINADGVKSLAEACQQIGERWIQGRLCGAQRPADWTDCDLRNSVRGFPGYKE